MSDNARTTQFAGHAQAVYDKLYDQFSNLFIEVDDCRDAEAEQTRKNILETIAESDYDLACHAIEHSGLVPRSADSVREYILNVPDLTELPKEK